MFKKNHLPLLQIDVSAHDNHLIIKSILFGVKVKENQKVSLKTENVPRVSVSKNVSCWQFRINHGALRFFVIVCMSLNPLKECQPLVIAKFISI